MFSTGNNDGKRISKGRCDSEDVPNKVAGSPLAWPQSGRSLSGSVLRSLIHQAPAVIATPGASITSKSSQHHLYYHHMR